MTREDVLKAAMIAATSIKGEFQLGAGRGQGRDNLTTHGISYSTLDIASLLAIKFGFKQFPSSKLFEDLVVGEEYEDNGEKKTITTNQARFYRANFIWECKRELLMNRVDDAFIPQNMLGMLSSEWLYFVMGLYYSCGGFKAENLTATLRFKTDSNGDLLNWIAKQASWKIKFDGDYTELRFLDNSNNPIREMQMSLFTGYMLKHLKTKGGKAMQGSFFDDMSSHEKQLFALGMFYGGGSASWSKRAKSSPIQQRLGVRTLIGATPADWNSDLQSSWSQFLTDALGTQVSVPEKASANIMLTQEAAEKLFQVSALFDRLKAPIPKKILQLRVTSLYRKLPTTTELSSINAEMTNKALKDRVAREITSIIKSLCKMLSESSSARKMKSKQSFASIDDKALKAALPVAQALRKDGLSATTIVKKIRGDKQFKGVFDGTNPIQMRKKLIALDGSLSSKG